MYLYNRDITRFPNVRLFYEKYALLISKASKGPSTTPLRTDVRMQLGHPNDKLAQLAQGEYNRMMTTDIFLSIR